MLEAKEKHYAQLTGEAGIPAIDGAAHLIRAAEGLGMAVGVGSSGAPEKIARNLEVSLFLFMFMLQQPPAYSDLCNLDVSACVDIEWGGCSQPGGEWF